MQGFPFSCSIEVRYRDVDGMDHVNNAVFVTYLEVARLRVWPALFDFSGSARSLPVIVARVVIDFRSPIALLDAVEVGIGVKSIGRSSFSFAYRIEASGRLAAEAETVLVLYDYDNSRAMPIDDVLRRRLEAFLLPAQP